jgi:hypothetical protein
MLIPFTDEYRQEHNAPFLPLLDEEGDTAAWQRVSALGSAASRGGRVAYVEAGFFGGTGCPAAAVWDADDSWPVPVGPYAINEALRLLGVQAVGGADEFDTLGLGRHRGIAGWVRPRR